MTERDNLMRRIDTMGDERGEQINQNLTWMTEKAIDLNVKFLSLAKI